MADELAPLKEAVGYLQMESEANRVQRLLLTDLLRLMYRDAPDALRAAALRSSEVLRAARHHESPLIQVACEEAIDEVIRHVLRR